MRQPQSQGDGDEDDDDEDLESQDDDDDDVCMTSLAVVLKVSFILFIYISNLKNVIQTVC